jgi:hypothetical protein
MVLKDCCKKIKVGEHYFVIQNGLLQYGCDHCRATHKEEYFSKNQERISDHNKKSVLYKREKICLEFNPRKGVCVNCGRKVGVSIKRTNYENYHDDDILKDTIELCIRYHKREHARLNAVAKAKDIHVLRHKTTLPTAQNR